MALGYALKYWRNKETECRMLAEQTRLLQKNESYANIDLS